jgi:hypothetical protein
MCLLFCAGLTYIYSLEPDPLFFRG